MNMALLRGQTLAVLCVRVRVRACARACVRVCVTVHLSIILAINQLNAQNLVL